MADPFDTDFDTPSDPFAIAAPRDPFGETVEQVAPKSAAPADPFAITPKVATKAPKLELPATTDAARLPFGIERREPEQGEIDFFERSGVPGYAADDNKVVLSGNRKGGVNYDAVARNEAARVFMRTNEEHSPKFDLSPEQEEFLDSNSYKGATDQERRDTIAARIFSGDPSAGAATADQLKFVESLKAADASAASGSNLGSELPDERDSMLKAAAKGLARGIDSTQGMLYGLAALAGDATGWDKLRDAGAEGYARNMQEAARNAGNVKFTDIEGVGDFAEWAAGGIGELVPTMATMIAGGGVGGLAAKAFLPSIGREAVKRLTLKKLKKEVGEAGVAKLVKDGGLREVLNKSIARAGATAGGFAANAGLNTGEVYSNFIDPQTGEIVNTAPRAGRVLGSIGGGLLAGALDTAVPLSILNRVSPVKSTAVKKIMDTISNSRTAKVAAAKLLLTTGAEGTTEALQELVGETVGVTVDQAREWDWEEFKPQAIEAFALGALGGAFMGGPVTVMDVMQGNKLAKQQDQSDSDFIEKQAGIYNSFKETGTGISSIADSYVASYEAAMSEADTKIAEGGLKPDSREAVDIKANALNDVVKEFNESRSMQEATDTSVEQDAPSATNPIAPTADPVSDKQSAQLNVQTAREVGDTGERQTIRGVVHYSNAPNLNELDPSFHGTGKTGAEAQRKAADPENYIDRIYVGLEGYQKEDGLLDNEYNLQVDDELLYNPNDDPAGLLQEARNEAGPNEDVYTLFEKKVSEAGYLGVRAEGENKATIFSRIPTDKPLTIGWWESETGKNFEPKKVFSKEGFATNAAAEINRVRNAPFGPDNGATFNADGTPYEGGGIVVGIVSDDTFTGTVTPEKQAAFAAKHVDKLQHPLAKTGIFKFEKSRNGSFDLSIIVPASMEAEALALADELRQESIYNMDTRKTTSTGHDGKNTKSVSDAEFFEIADRFVVDDGTRQTVRAPEASGQAASAVEIFNDKSVMSPPVTRGRVKIADLAAAFDERAKELGYNIQPNDYSPAALEHISEAMAHDMARQLSGDGSGVGWYDIKTRSAMELMARLHPEISTDPRAELTFKTFVSIFSQNNDVVTNFEAANRAYAYFKKNGKLPSWEFPGKSNNIIRANAEKLMSLIESEGHEAVSALLAESKSVAEWNADGYEVNGELKSTKVTGAMVLMGSKIGSFYGNLNGDFTTLTADLWFSRMWNRYTGNVAKKFDINDAEQTDEVLQELKSYRGKSLLHGFSKSQILADKKVLEQWARKAAKEYALGKYKNKHPLNVKANTLYKKMDGVTNDIPRNGSERQAMRGAVSMAIDKLVKDGYPRLEVADAQAILWYSEKDLYKLYKSVNKSSEKTDYEIAAQKVLDSKGIDSTVDDQFVRSEPGADGARTGTSQPKYGQRDPSVEAGATAELKTTREASPLKRTSQTKSQATTLIKNVTKAAARMGLRVDVRAPDTTNPDPFFRNVGGKYNPSQKTINLVISSEMTHTDQVVVLHEVLHDLYADAPVAIQEALLRWTTKMSNGELAPLTDRISTDPRIRPDNPYGLPELEFQEEQLVESLAAEGVDSQIAEGIVADLIRILKDLWFRAAIKFQEMFNGQVSEEIAIAWAQNKTQAIIAGQSPYLDLWSMVRGGRMSTTVDDNSAMHQGLSSFAYRMSNGKMVLNDLVPVDAEAAIANMDSIIDQGNIEMIMDDTDNRRVGEEGLRYTTERSVERMAQLDADYFAALQVGNTELADRLMAEAADLAGYNVTAHHVTTERFNAFDPSMAAQGGVFWFTENLEKIESGETGAGLRPGLERIILNVYLKAENQAGWDEYGKLGLGEIEGRGYDSIKLDDDYVIFNPNQIKSADTITRDDSGNVIPLSQRFQVESDNIRFTQRPVAATLAAQKEQTMRRLESSVRQDIASLNELDAALAPTLNKLSPAVTREEFFGAIPGLSDPRLEIQKVLIAYESNKNLTMPDYQDSVSANDRLDTLTDAQNAVAREKTYRSIQTAQRQLGEAVSNNVIQSEKSAAKIEASEEAYNALIAKMGDLKETEREVRKGIAQQIQLLLEDLRANNRAQSKKGIAGQILQDLANKNEGLPFPKSTEKLLKGLINNDTPLLAIARDLMKLDVEWSGKGPEVYKAALAAIKEEIKVNLDSPLGELLSGKPFEVGAASLKALVESGDVDSLRGSAFLATMVAFVKNNRQAANALAASNQSAQVNLEIAEGLAAVKNAKVIEDANRILDIYRTKTPNGVRDRIVISFAKAKQEMNTAKKALAKSKKNAAMLSPAAGDMHKAYNKASKEIGKNGNWTFQDGAEVPIPVSNEQNPREVLYGKHEEIDMTQFGENVQGRKDGMTYIGKMAKRITDYLGANQESKDTYEYQELSRIAEALGQQYLEAAVVQADPGGLGFRLRDPGSQMRNSGTVAGTRVAGRLEEFAKLNLKYQGQVFDGYRFSRKYRAARKAAGMGSNDAFYRMSNKALAFLEGERVLDGQAAFDAMFDALSIDPNMARALSQKNAKKEFQALLIEWARQSQAMDNVRANEGLLVRDEGGDVNPFTGVKRDLYRDSLNRGLFMVPRVLSRGVFSAMSTWMKIPGNEGVLTSDSPLNVNDYADNPDGVAARVSQILGSNGSFFNRVVNPFILNDRSNKYPHPQDEAVKLDLSVVAAAWSESGQDVVKTAEILADQYGADPTEYVPKFFSAFKAQLVKFQKKNSEAQESARGANMGGVSMFAADSRVGDDFPSEMTEYITFSHQQNSVSIKQIAIEKAMGRNMEGLYADIDATARDINEQADAYNSAVADSDGDMAAVKKLLGKNFKIYQAASKAEKLGTYEAKRWVDNMKSILGNNDNMSDIGMWETGFGMVITGLLSGWKTGAKQLSQVYSGFMGDGAISRWNFLDPFQKTMETGVMLASWPFRLFGMGFDLKSVHRTALLDAGVQDFEGAVPISDRFSDLGFNREFEKDGRSWTKKIARGIQSAASGTTFNRGERKQFSPSGSLMPFRALNMSSAMFDTNSVMKKMIKISGDVSAYLKENPNAVESDITAENLGYKDRLWGWDDATDFTNFKTQLNAAQGISLIAMANEADALKADGKYPLSKDTIASAYAFTKTNRSFESTLVSRPTFSQKNTAGRLSLSLLGWSLEVAMHTTDMLLGRDTTGRKKETKKLASSIAGLKAIMFGVLPYALLYSLFFDFWDEEISGKKSDIRPLTTKNGLDEFAMSVLERVGHMGPIGMWGEVANSAVNMGTGKKVLSFDERVVWASTLMSAQNMLSTFIAVEGFKDPANLTYNTFWRPMLQTMGFGGTLSNTQVINNVFGFDNAESRTAGRTNVNNALRGAGRSVGVEVRVFGAGGSSRPTPTTPHVTNMILAALSDDGERFKKSYDEAVRVTMKFKDISQGEAQDKVQRSFASRHPIKSVFRSPPTTKEYQQMLAVMNPNMRFSVEDGLASFSKWGQTIGVKPYFGKRVKQTKQKKLADTPRRPTIGGNINDIINSQFEI